uniref:putative maturase n=1 Tax=Klebsormidium dissectum TaxID=329816 RepID=UPI00286D3D88|nr:putative maturase [Klebsormidium dissectum]YP_010932717.1 putative maturase [Klebsormidium dissectum]WKT06483.1 putative maturase [Klebsormidium dissectum]WKT06484.1 putative maturase [Klebsormidium dissectum]
MSALQRLDQIRLQSKRHKRVFAKGSYPFFCKEDLWLFVQEKNQWSYDNTIDEHCALFNSLTKRQTKLIQQSDLSSNNNTYKVKCLLCEIIRIVFDSYSSLLASSSTIANRENQNSHAALELVGKSWRDINWIFQADFHNSQGLFQGFKNLFQKRIQDTLCSHLLTLIVNTKTINVSNNWPQVAMTRLCISLNNMYFYELDTLLFWIQHTNKKIELQVIPSVCQHVSINLIPKEKSIVKHFATKVVYVRHAGSWMIGTNGPISFVKALFLQVHQLFNQCLKLKSEVNKAKISNLYAKSISFVGYRMLTSNNFDLQFELPLEKMLVNLSLEGFCETSGQPMPKKEWASEHDWFIVSTFHRLILQIQAYWGPAFNQSILRQIKYTLYISCAKTLAHKHRVTASQIFGKYGKALGINHPFHSGIQIKISLEKIQRASWVQPRRYFTKYDSFSSLVFIEKH